MSWQPCHSMHRCVDLTTPTLKLRHFESKSSNPPPAPRSRRASVLARVASSRVSNRARFADASETRTSLDIAPPRVRSMSIRMLLMNLLSNNISLLEGSVFLNVVQTDLYTRALLKNFARNRIIWGNRAKVTGQDSNRHIFETEHTAHF